MLGLRDYLTSGGKYPRFWGDFHMLPEQDQAELGKWANITLARASEFLSRIGHQPAVKITSGWRPASHNAAIGGSKGSRHCYCQAIDLWDPSKEIGQAAARAPELLEELGLWMESLVTTHAAHEPAGLWVHFQVLPPKSGNRIFIP